MNTRRRRRVTRRCRFEKMPVREDGGSPFARERRFAPSDQITPRASHSPFDSPPTRILWERPLRPRDRRRTGSPSSRRPSPLAPTRATRAQSQTVSPARTRVPPRVHQTALTAIAHLNHFWWTYAMGGASVPGSTVSATRSKHPSSSSTANRSSSSTRATSSALAANPRDPRPRLRSDRSIRSRTSGRSVVDEWRRRTRVTRRRRERRASREVACRGGRRGPARPARRRRAGAALARRGWENPRSRRR